MSNTAGKLATYADLEALPDDVRAEIIRGELVTQPAPLPRHSKVVRALGARIGGPFDDDDGYGGPGGWWIFQEVDVQFENHENYRPDLSGWRRERLVDPGDVRPITVIPDWVAEVLSSTTEEDDRTTKRDTYASSGVGFYWIVDPVARVLEAFELRDSRWTLIGAYGSKAVVRIPPFEAIELDVGRLFLPR